MRLFRYAATAFGFSVFAMYAATVAEVAQDVPQTMMGLPLVFQDDFESGKTDRWAPTDPKAWKIEEIDGNKCFAQFQGSKYEPKVRSPYNIAWAKDVSVSDFVLQARMWQI